MLSETIRVRFELTALHYGFYLTNSLNFVHIIQCSYCFLFIHYEPLGSSSGDFGGDYLRSGLAFKNSPPPHLIMHLKCLITDLKSNRRESRKGGDQHGGQEGQLRLRLHGTKAGPSQSG